MLPMTRANLEILLDSPDRRDYVVSAFADLRVKDGFRRYFDAELQNQRRAAESALALADARKAIEPNLEAVRRAVETADPAAKGLAVFSGAERGLLHTVPLGFPVENRLVIDEDPFVLPLLENWYGVPAYLAVVVDSRQAVVFEVYGGVPEPVEEFSRAIDEATQRDKPRFTYKKRFAQARHEHLQALDDDKFLQDVADRVGRRWAGGEFGGLILLGQAPVTSAFRRLLPREAAAAVAEEAPQAMTDAPAEVVDDVRRALESWRRHRESELLAELRQRWKEGHLVADGPTAVLDALQQGRATQVAVGLRHDLAGARCRDCGYRFGAPTERCLYCGGETRNLNAIQEILRMALRHRVDLYLFPRDLETDPLADAGGVCALLRAEANWAPDRDTARSTQGN